MKTKVIFLAIIFFLSFAFISCQKDATPFSPQIDAKKQSENTTTTISVSTQSKTQESSFADAGKKRGYSETNQDVRGDSRIHHGTSDKQEMEKTGTEVNNLISVNGISMPTKSPHNRGNSRRGGDMETDQGLDVKIRPFRWNTNWDHSEDSVTVRIFGEGIEDIDPSSVRMVGPEGDETGEPVMSEAGPFFVMAKFLKSEAIGIIPEPKSGETYEIQVTWGNNSGLDVTNGLFYPIQIAGKKYEEGDLSLVIRPNEWNRAWGNVDDEDNGDDTEDVVTARISGEGFKDINPDTVEMDYPDGGLGPIAPIPFSYEFGGGSFVIKFNQSDAISLILDPKRGDIYEILVTGNFTDGTPFELTDTITISGKKSGEGLLSLEIKPKTWNLSWANGDDDGEITASISGEDFDKIDTTRPIKMSGPVGTPIDPTGTELAGFSFVAKFSQSQAIALIPNPQLQDSYNIAVSFYLTDGTYHVLSCSVPIKGK